MNSPTSQYIEDNIMRIIAASLLFSAIALAPTAFAAEPKDDSQTSGNSAENSSDNSEAETQKSEKPREAKKICRRIQDMGSRRSQRVCMTREQWKDFNNAN